jgi:hypothetical protein
LFRDVVTLATAVSIRPGNASAISDRWRNLHCDPASTRLVTADWAEQRIQRLQARISPGQAVLMAERPHVAGPATG